ncbi:MAG: thioredoxin family protein [Pseudomonadales bacterium]|nr:thioredoxin family protein [Pseudomonadales bacterium]
MSYFALFLALLFVDPPQSTPILVHFTADWCPACQTVKPVIHQLKQEGYDVRIVDVDQNTELARRYGVQGLPCFTMVVDGHIQERRVGVVSISVLRQMLDQPPRLNVTRTRSDSRRIERSLDDRQSQDTTPRIRLMAPRTSEGEETKLRRWFTINRAKHTD